ncbi:hypothetical protein QUF74_10000 [Candidatus Halobeggiatoa sp. HSG11]|nr:hypothetical protein [Candidatus Halobeggiatoa sp. HSG11]
MDYLDIWYWVLANKEWLFSGILVSFFSFFTGRKSYQKQETKLSNTINNTLNIVVKDTEELKQLIIINEYDKANLLLDKLTNNLEKLKEYSILIRKITHPAVIGNIYDLQRIPIDDLKEYYSILSKMTSLITLNPGGHVRHLEVPLDNLLEYKSILDEIDKKMTVVIEKSSKLNS